jgi:hypothetical protein
MGSASGRPACRAQHAMINGEARALVQDAQRRTHGAPARAQQGLIFPRSGGHLSKLGMIRAEVMDGEYSTGIHG